MQPDQPNVCREIRRRLGLTQTELAARLGVNIRTIIRWESGETPISLMAELALSQVEANG